MQKTFVNLHMASHNAHDIQNANGITVPPTAAYLLMGWLRLVGSLQLQVSFAKEPYTRDYMLQTFLSGNPHLPKRVHTRL